MGQNSKIEWTDQTDNIIIVQGGGWWCRKISPGCAHCYAEKLNQSPFFGGNKLNYTGDAPQLVLRTEFFEKWQRQTKPRKHFVASMTDIFGEWVEAEWNYQMLDAMASAKTQTFQMLTKRADVMAERVLHWAQSREFRRMPQNIWIGFTAENQEWFDKRWAEVKKLLHLHPIIFVSIEPMLGAVILPPDFLALGKRAQVICGGESGPNARAMHPEWARSLRGQCQAAGVPFFFKQWGEWAPRAKICGGGTDFQSIDPQCKKWPHVIRLGENGKNTRDLANCGDDVGEEVFVQRVGKALAGRILDDREWNEFPTVS